MTTRPTPPDTYPDPTLGATTEDWEQFFEQYTAWVENDATDEELLAEIAEFGAVEGRPLSPWEREAHQLCDRRRARPKQETAKKTRTKKET